MTPKALGRPRPIFFGASPLAALTVGPAGKRVDFDMARILVVDDEPVIRAIIRETLEKKGHTVDCAADGQEGLLSLSEAAYDILVCDLLMPVREGIETIRDARRLYPSISIVVVTGGSPWMPSGFLDKAKAFGANRAMTKPLDMDEFGRVIDELLSAPVSAPAPRTMP